MEVRPSSNPGWEEEVEEIVPPVRPGIQFRCRTCNHIWYGTHEEDEPFAAFCDRNKTCAKCCGSDILMRFVTFSIQR